jgi:glycosyltransferase involved in cell wall biosynthesis
MTRPPLVSVLMPFLNAGSGFRAALRSVLNQTYENWELLLCDDGSTDGSLAIAESFADERIMVWSDGKRQGLAKRLNECIDRARGEFIARMDADDVSYPERLRNQVAFLLHHQEIDLVGCNMLIFGEDGTPIGKRSLPVEHEQIVARPSLGFGLAHPTWMARASWFRQHRYDPNALRYEDVELLYRSCRSSRFANLPDILYGYREMRGGFRKRLQTRIGRVRYLNARRAAEGRWTLYRAALAESAKVVADAALVAGSGRYAMLRFHAERLSDRETADWRKLFDTVSETAPESALSLMMLATSHETIGTFFARQIEVLAKGGFHVHAVSSPGEGLDKLHHPPNVSTHGIAMERRPNPRRDFVSFVKLFRLLRRLRPNIVHAHTPKAGLLGMAAAKAAGVSVRLYTIHGLPLLTRKGTWRRLLELAERASCALATQVHAVSPSLAELVVAMKLCPAGKLSTLGDGSCAGIDLERFNPEGDWRERATAARRSCGIPEDALVLSFIGRVARDKGIAILAAAWQQLAHSPNLHLWIVGEEDSSDPVPAPILAELRKHERVHFDGRWASDVAVVYAASDIIALPTFREGLSQVALEAGAMGVPIVSTRIPGVINSVQDGVTGLLVPPGVSEPFVEAVQRLVDDPGLRTTLGEAARRHVSARFSEQRVNQLWISEYRNLTRESLDRFADRRAAENPR